MLTSELKKVVPGGNEDSAPQKIIWTHELVEKFWNGFAKSRLVEHSFSRSGGQSLIVAIDHLLPKDGLILDFGAGDGDLIKLLCSRDLKVAAYEPSEGRTHLLNNKLAPYAGFAGTINAKSSVNFDVILMIEVIEHILDVDLNQSLQHLKSLMRKDGLLIITTPNNEDLDLGMAYCPVSNTLFHRWQHVRSFTAQSLSDLLQKFGFEEIVTHQVEFNAAHFLKYDRIWGDSETYVNPPPHITDLRANKPTQIGGGSNLLYIGRFIG